MTSEEKRKRSWGFKFLDIHSSDQNELKNNKKLKSIAYRYSKEGKYIEGVARMHNTCLAENMANTLRCGHSSAMVEVFGIKDGWRSAIKKYKDMDHCVIIEDNYAQGTLPIIVSSSLNESKKISDLRLLEQVQDAANEFVKRIEKDFPSISLTINVRHREEIIAEKVFEEHEKLENNNE